MVRSLNFLQRQHRHQMFESYEFCRWFGPDSLCRGIERSQISEFILQFLEFIHLLVILVVCDNLATRIVGLVVLSDFIDQLGVACFGMRVCHDSVLFMAYPSCGQLARVAFRTASYLICVIEKQPEKLQKFVLELPQLLRKTCPYLTGNQ